MDNKKGNFEPISEKKFENQIEMVSPFVFKEREILEIRGSRFRIQRIQKKKIILKLLPQLKEDKNQTKMKI